MKCWHCPKEWLCCSATEQQYLSVSSWIREHVCWRKPACCQTGCWYCREGGRGKQQLPGTGTWLYTGDCPCSSGRKGEQKGTAKDRKSCLQAVSTLGFKTLVFHDVENQLGSGHRPLIACTEDTTSQLLLYSSQAFSVLGVSC